MAFTDFDIYTGRDNGQAWNNSGSGDAILHATLSSPLADGGSYCRGWRGINAPIYTKTAHHISVAASVGGGAYVGHTTALAISLRAKMRLDGSDDVGKTGNGLGLHCRTRHVNDGQGEFWTGYGFRFSSLLNRTPSVYTTAGSVPQAALFARASSSPSAGAEMQVVNDPTTSAPWVRGKWYGFRFDYTPTGASADELKAFLLTGSDMDDDASWSLIATMVIGPGNAHYIARVADHRCGFYYSLDWNDNNYSGSTLPDPRPFIDSFSVRSWAVP